MSMIIGPDSPTVLMLTARAASLEYGNGSAIGYDQFATIQAAINAVASGGTIYVYSGTYRQNLTVNKSVTMSAKII